MKWNFRTVLVVGLFAGWSATALAGWFSYTAKITLARDHKKGDVVKCSTLFHDTFDSKAVSCEEAK